MGGWAEGVRLESKVEQDSACPVAGGRLTHQALPGEQGDSLQDPSPFSRKG